MANRVQVFNPLHAISWEPGHDPGDGNLRFGGWIWRYDLAPLGPSETEVRLSYDWSAVPEVVRQVGGNWAALGLLSPVAVPLWDQAPNRFRLSATSTCRKRPPPSPARAGSPARSTGTPTPPTCSPDNRRTDQGTIVPHQPPGPAGRSAPSTSTPPPAGHACPATGGPPNASPRPPAGPSTSWRHTRIRELKDDNCPLSVLQKITGHRSPAQSTTPDPGPETVRTWYQNTDPDARRRRGNRA